MKKILYFDVETTGLDPVANDIIQIGLIIEIGGREVERHDIKIQPFNYDNIELSALETHNITIDEMREYMDPKAAYRELVNILSRHVNKYDRHDKYYPAGFNVKFDLDFLKQFFLKCGDKYGVGSFQNWRYIDPLPVLYMLDCYGEISLPNYKLETVAEHFDIPIKAHDALSDIEATIKLIKIVNNMITGDICPRYRDDCDG